MKQQIAVAAIIMFAIQITAAQVSTQRDNSKEKKIALYTKNLLNGLRSWNTGVVESSMRLTAQLTMRYPNADVNELTEVINTIWMTNPSGTTRYKAYIALAICENPQWFSHEPEITAAGEETFYRAASTRLQAQLLSTIE